MLAVLFFISTILCISIKNEFVLVKREIAQTIMPVSIMVFIGWVLAKYIGSFTSVEAVEEAIKSCSLSACIPTDGPEYFDDNLSFIENLLSETSRTLSMDTHYPESMDDLADCDLEEESEEQLRHQQELVAQALEIEREFWNCD